MDTQQSPHLGLRELALFAGAGGGILGGHLLGWRTVCAVEWEPYPAAVLAARQNEGILPPFPIWDDVQTFDGNPWRGLVDVVSGGSPCQNISSAGPGEGIHGPKSRMWKHMARILREIGCLGFLENSPMLAGRGLDVVLKDLAENGYDAQWDVFSAASMGGEQIRERLFLLAYPNVPQCQGGCVSGGIHQEDTHSRHPRWGKDKPGVDRMANGTPAQVDRLKAIGNAQVPIVAATAFRVLHQRMMNRATPPQA